MQMSFVGIGAVVVGKLGADTPVARSRSLLAAVATGVRRVPRRAAGAAPARHLPRAVHAWPSPSSWTGSSSGTATSSAAARRSPCPGPTILGVELTSEQAMFVLTAAAVALYANVFLAVRRSAFGRMLVRAARLPHRQPDDGHGPRGDEAAGCSACRRCWPVAPARCSARCRCGWAASTSSTSARSPCCSSRRSSASPACRAPCSAPLFFVVLPEALRELGSEGGGGAHRLPGAAAAHHRGARHRRRPPARGPRRPAAGHAAPRPRPARRPLAGARPTGIRRWTRAGVDRARRWPSVRDRRSWRPCRADGALDDAARDRAARHRGRLRHASRCSTASTSSCRAARSSPSSGPNGAGKTTLLKVISGALRPTRGTRAHGGPRRHRAPRSTGSPRPACASSPRAAACSRTSRSARTS